MASRPTTSDINETIEAIVSKFQQFDLNGDGVIELDELSSVLTALDDGFWSTSNVVRLLNSMDADRDGTVDYEDFVCYIFRKPKKTKKCRVHKEFSNEMARETDHSLSEGAMNSGKAEAALYALAAEPDQFIDPAFWGAPDPPVAALGVLAAVIDLLKGVDPRMEDFRQKHPAPRSWKDVRSLLNDPHVFVEMLEKFAEKNQKGEVPEANFVAAHDALLQIGRHDLHRAKKSSTQSLSLLSVWIDSTVKKSMCLDAEASSDSSDEEEGRLGTATSGYLETETSGAIEISESKRTVNSAAPETSESKWTLDTGASS